MLQKIKLFEGDDIDKLYHDITKMVIAKGTDLKPDSQCETKRPREIFVSMRVGC